jgi:hypothetical protein
VTDYPWQERLRRVDQPPLRSPLLAAARNVTSQSGEDGILGRLCWLLSPAKFCVEFGAWDGVKFSNCNSLVTAKGWGGLFVEADAGRFEELRANFSGYPAVRTLNVEVQTAHDNGIDDILANQVGHRGEVGIMSIDVDGLDWHIWNRMRAKPQVVVIEVNPTVPNDVYFVQECSKGTHHGSSMLAMRELGLEKGYGLACATQFNAIFVRDDLFHRVGVTDTSLEALYRPIQDGRIFQLYDGSLRVAGVDRLVWLDIPLDQDDFQILPKSARRFV